MALRAGVEILTHPEDSASARTILGAMCSASPIPCMNSSGYSGKHDFLMLWGYGRPGNAQTVRRHVKRGGRAVLWDLGYFGDRKSYARLSIDRWHPQAWLDWAPNDNSRWRTLNIQLRNDANHSGHIIVIGMGKKSRQFLGVDGWELRKAIELRERFPGRQIIIRQKRDPAPIEQALQGASLVVCRHSNCAVDAVIAGVPFECEDGAAQWLAGKEFTPENRANFLNRLAWWQWRADEAAQAWKFILKVTA